MRSVIVELSGGLGNQLFQASAAIAIAEENNAQAFAYFGRHFARSSHGNSIFDLDWHGQLIQQEPTKLCVASRALLFRLTKYKDMPPGPAQRFMWNESQDWIVPVVKNRRTYLRGYFQNAEFTLRNKNFIMPTLLNKSAQFLGAVELALSHKPIGIHIRLGDYHQHADTHGILSVDYYRTAIEMLGPVARSRPIWVFSDDEGQAAQVLSEAGLSSNLKLVSTFGLSDLESLLLLSRCNSLILGNSTFSIWAGILGASEAKVIRPDPPFIGLPAHDNLYPRAFLAVDSGWPQQGSPR